MTAADVVMGEIERVAAERGGGHAVLVAVEEMISGSTMTHAQGLTAVVRAIRDAAQGASTLPTGRSVREAATCERVAGLLSAVLFELGADSRLIARSPGRPLCGRCGSDFPMVGYQHTTTGDAPSDVRCEKFDGEG